MSSGQRIDALRTDYGTGHARYEKKSPAFFQNLVHLLVGPLFLVNELIRVRAVDPP